MSISTNSIFTPPPLSWYSKAMSFFCLLWMPLFYLFWRSFTEETDTARGGWALLGGSVIALSQFFIGPLVNPGGFGFSRWLSASVDIVTLPALLPLVVCCVLVSFGLISDIGDFTHFAFIWLIPVSAMRALSWSSLRDPVFLVLVPVLWTAIILGIPFLLTLFLNNQGWVLIPISLAILVVPFAASSAHWAFYSQNALLGSLFLTAASAPMLVSVIMSFVGSEV